MIPGKAIILLRVRCTCCEHCVKREFSVQYKHCFNPRLHSYCRSSGTHVPFVKFVVEPTLSTDNSVSAVGGAGCSTHTNNTMSGFGVAQNLLSSGHKSTTSGISSHKTRSDSHASSAVKQKQHDGEIGSSIFKTLPPAAAAAHTPYASPSISRQLSSSRQQSTSGWSTLGVLQAPAIDSSSSTITGEKAMDMFPSSTRYCAAGRRWPSQVSVTCL